MSSVREATAAVSVLSVEAGSRGVRAKRSATICPRASIITAEVSLPTEGSDNKSFTSLFAFWLLIFLP